VAAVHRRSQHLIVHRDSRLEHLVTPTDAKLLDFGIERLDERQMIHTMPSRRGRALMTPEHASPNNTR